MATNDEKSETLQENMFYVPVKKKEEVKKTFGELFNELTPDFSNIPEVLLKRNEQLSQEVLKWKEMSRRQEKINKTLNDSINVMLERLNEYRKDEKRSYHIIPEENRIIYLLEGDDIASMAHNTTILMPYWKEGKNTPTLIDCELKTADNGETVISIKYFDTKVSFSCKINNLGEVVDVPWKQVDAVLESFNGLVGPITRKSLPDEYKNGWKNS